MVFIPLVVVWIGQFCRDVTGRQNVKVAVTGWLLFCCYFRSVYYLSRYVGFVWGYVWVVSKVLVAVGIGSEVLVLSLCTSFLMSVVGGSLCCKWHIMHMISQLAWPDLTVMTRSDWYDQTRLVWPDPTGMTRPDWYNQTRLVWPDLTGMLHLTKSLLYSLHS